MPRFSVLVLVLSGVVAAGCGVEQEPAQAEPMGSVTEAATSTYCGGLGSSCPAGKHNTGNYCSPSCPFYAGCGSITGPTTNAYSCTDNDTEVFEVCSGGGASCPPGWRATNYYCSMNCYGAATCGTITGPTTNAARCQIIDPCTLVKSQRVIPYGGYGTYDGCQYRDRCEGTLVPMNVDSRSSLYPKAPAGGFSCWGNVPDVLCTWTSRINGYVNVRQCYHRPDGTTVNYGCNDC